MKTQHTTQASTPTAKADILVLIEQQVSFYDLRICYRLLAESDKHGTHFLICANGNGEALCPVGYDLISAMRYFNTVVREKVCPCMLSEVLEDLLFSDALEPLSACEAPT